MRENVRQSMDAPGDGIWEGLLRLALCWVPRSFVLPAGDYG